MSDEDYMLGRRRDALEKATSLYEDARARTDTIRGIGLAAMGFLSVLAVVAGPESVSDLGYWAIPPLVLVAVGLVTALATLLKTPVMVPYRSEVLGSEEFAGQPEDDAIRQMLGAVLKAEFHTRHHNNRAAVLVNITLSTFVSAVVLMVFQLALGPVAGTLLGSASAATVVAAAFIVRRRALWPKKSAEGNKDD